MSDTILLTGGTGFLGAELAERLVRDPDTKLYILIRAADPAAAMHRLEESLYFFNGVRHQCGQFKPVEPYFIGFAGFSYMPFYKNYL